MFSDHFVLVEDRAEEVELFEMALDGSQLKHDFIWLKDGEEAIAFFADDTLAERKRMPKIIVLDLKLPKIDGMNVLKYLRSNKDYDNVPIVILTSSSREDDKRVAYEIGANSFLVKSSNLDQFMSTIQDMTTYWMLRNVLPERN